MQRLIEWQNVLLHNPIYFGILGVVMWCFVLITISRITGWSRLAEKYQTRAKPESNVMRAVKARWGSVMISGNIYTIACTNEGMYLGVLFPFRLGHPPLLIPWHDIKTSRISGLLLPRIQLEFANGMSRPFQIYENTAKRIKECSNGKFSY